MNDFYCYIAFRPWNGTPCYVGKGGASSREVDHNYRGARHGNKHFANIFKKAKRLRLSVIFIRIICFLTEEAAFKTEAALIKAIGRGKNGPLVNLTDGGEGISGFHHSEKTKEKCRAIHAGIPISEEHRLKIKATHALPETRKKCGAANIGRKLSTQHKAKFCAGRKHTKESRAKISAGNKGKIRTQEVRDRISATKRAASLVKSLEKELRT